MRLKKKYIFLSITLLPLLLYASLFIPFPKKRLKEAPVISLRLVDRNNVILREVLSDEGGRCSWVKLGEISSHLLNATVVAEDKHFYYHDGFNPLAIIRAFYLNLKKGRVVSGASTITQQLVRNIYRFPRNIFSKIIETWLAMRLENSISKEDILIQYFNRISYGNKAIGIEAASLLYFDKPSKDLSLAEAAFLAALPRSPSLLNPYRNFLRAKKRQKKILTSMYSWGYINYKELERALEEKFNLISKKENFRAPHFCDYILQKIPDNRRRELNLIKTSIDYSLQEKVEAILKGHIKSIEKKEVTNGAAVIIDNITGEILSMVGSKDFFDELHDGQVNGALSLRQPGSTLKPFTYALAFEKGKTPSSIINDVETQFITTEGGYYPENYDKRFHGPVRMRSALASSYNVPAVSILDSLGPDLLFHRLKLLGFDSLKKSPSFYGVGLTLGNGEVTLLELVRAYSVFARGGTFLQEKSILSIIDDENAVIINKQKLHNIQIFSPQIAYIITHILKDKDARIPSFGYYSPLNLPFPCASKTGTSKDFRDNWTVGFTPKHTVGVWIGNFSGKPMFNVSGITGCGPIFKDIMVLLEKRKPQGKFDTPPKLVKMEVCSSSGKIPGNNCISRIEEIFIKGTEPQSRCDHDFSKRIVAVNIEEQQERTGYSENRIKILSPANGEEFKIDPILRKEYQKVELKAQVLEDINKDEIEWWFNEKRIGTSSFPFSFHWTLEPGIYTIKARAKIGNRAIESQTIKVKVII